MSFAIGELLGSTVGTGLNTFIPGAGNFFNGIVKDWSIGGSQSTAKKGIVISAADIAAADYSKNVDSAVKNPEYDKWVKDWGTKNKAAQFGDSSVNVPPKPRRYLLANGGTTDDPAASGSSYLQTGAARPFSLGTLSDVAKNASTKVGSKILNLAGADKPTATKHAGVTGIGVVLVGGIVVGGICKALFGRKDLY